MRHVSNMHTYFDKSIFQFSIGNCIIKIFSIIRVDGDSENIAHIASAFYFRFGYFCR